MRAFQLGFVVVKGRNLKSTGRHEAVPLGLATRDNPIHIQRHHVRPVFAAQHAKDTVQRADPAQGPGPPTHRFRPGEIAHGAFQHLCHDLCRVAARLFDHRKEHAAFLFVPLDQVFARHTGPAQKAFDGLFRCIDAGAFAFLLQIRRPVRKPIDAQRQTTRRRVGGGPGIGQTGLDQTIRHKTLEIIRRLALHARGDFFGKKLDQKVRHQEPPFSRSGQSSPKGLPS